MHEEGSGGSRGTLDGSRVFWMRMIEILFRHPMRFVLPIVLLTGVGVALANQSGPVYESRGVLSAAANPLVSDSEIRGTSIQAWESPAQGTGRIINEQLRTAAFTAGIAERAGLSDALANGLITLDMVRESVWTTTQGNSLLTVNAQWADPTSAYQLVTATIDSYHDFLSETVASDSSEAEQYFTELRDEAQADLDGAQLELSTFVAGLPEIAEGEERPTQTVIAIDSLRNRINRAEEQVTAAETSINAARLTVLQSQSEAGRSLVMVDEPMVPTAPVATLRAMIQTVGFYLVLGGMLSVVVLVVSTILDRSVSSPADLASIPGIDLTAVVPPLGSVAAQVKRRQKLGSESTSETVTPQTTLPADQSVPA